MSMAVTVLLILLLIGSLFRLRLIVSSLRHPVEATITFAQPWLEESLRIISHACFSISCLLCVSRQDPDIFVFALSLFILSADSEAEALATLASVSPDAFATRLPEVGITAEARLRAARLRNLPCLTPDSHRQSGGSYTVLLFVAFTSVADLLWGFSHQHDLTSEGFVPFQRAEKSLLFLKLLLKGLFIVASVPLRLSRTISRKVPNSALTARSMTEDVMLCACTPICGGLLFATSAALLFLACLSSAILAEGVEREDIQADPILAPSFHDESIKLTGGPAGMLAVLGCTVALQSGGIFLAAILFVTSLMLLLADCIWLAFGPVTLSVAELGTVLHGNVSAIWMMLSPSLQGQAIMLCFQIPLVLNICVSVLCLCLAKGRFTQFSSSPRSTALL